MKSLRYWCLSAAAAAAFLAATPASAASAAAKASIPFAFKAGNKVFSPGTYVFKYKPSSNVMTIRNADGESFLAPVRVVTGEPLARQELKFTRQNGVHQLDNIVVQSHEGAQRLSLR